MVAMFGAVCQFGPHSSCLTTDRGLSGPAAWGLPHLVVSRQTYPLSPRIGQLCCPVGPCRGWRFPLELRFHHLALVTGLRVGVGVGGDVDTYDARRRRISQAQSPKVWGSGRAPCEQGRKVTSPIPPVCQLWPPLLQQFP